MNKIKNIHGNKSSVWAWLFALILIGGFAFAQITFNSAVAHYYVYRLGTAFNLTWLALWLVRTAGFVLTDALIIWLAGHTANHDVPLKTTGRAWLTLLWVGIPVTIVAYVTGVATGWPAMRSVFPVFSYVAMPGLTAILFAMLLQPLMRRLWTAAVPSVFLLVVAIVPLVFKVQAGRYSSSFSFLTLFMLIWLSAITLRVKTSSAWKILLGCGAGLVFSIIVLQFFAKMYGNPAIAGWLAGPASPLVMATAAALVVICRNFIAQHTAKTLTAQPKQLWLWTVTGATVLLLVSGYNAQLTTKALVWFQTHVGYFHGLWMVACAVLLVALAFVLAALVGLLAPFLPGWKVLGKLGDRSLGTLYDRYSLQYARWRLNQK